MSAYNISVHQQASTTLDIKSFWANWNNSKTWIEAFLEQFPLEKSRFGGDLTLKSLSFAQGFLPARKLDGKWSLGHWRICSNGREMRSFLHRADLWPSETLVHFFHRNMRLQKMSVILVFCLLRCEGCCWWCLFLFAVLCRAIAEYGGYPKKRCVFFILLDFVRGEFSYGFNKSLGLSNQHTYYFYSSSSTRSWRWTWKWLWTTCGWVQTYISGVRIYDSWNLENRLLTKEYASHVMSMPTCRSTWGMQSLSVPFVHKWFFGGGEWSSENTHPHINSCTCPE